MQWKGGADIEHCFYNKDREKGWKGRLGVQDEISTRFFKLYSKVNCCKNKAKDRIISRFLSIWIL